MRHYSQLIIRIQAETAEISAPAELSNAESAYPQIQILMQAAATTRLIPTTSSIADSRKSSIPVQTRNIMHEDTH